MDENKFPPLEQPANVEADPKSQLKIRKLIVNDYEFLCALLRLIKGASKPDSLFLPKIPNIIEAARNAHSPDQASGLYNDVTRIEFHQLLLDLLKRFGEALSIMSDAINSLSKPKGQASFNRMAFKYQLDNVRMYGYLLMRLARGKAFQMHVESIESALARCILTDRLRSAPGDGSQSMEVGVMEVDDVEDIETILRANGSLSKAFGIWLRLIVVHFDAVEILVTFVNDPVQFPFRGISIKMLLGPTTGTAIITWPELLRDSKLFPQIDMQDISSTKTNANIAKFLDGAIKDAVFENACYSLIQKAKKQWSSGTGRHGARATLVNLNKLVLSKPAVLPEPTVLPESTVLPEPTISPKPVVFPKPTVLPESTILTTIIAALNKSSDWKKDPQIANTITNGIETLCGMYKKPGAGNGLYLDMARAESFGGRLHCEAFMAFLLDHATHGTDLAGEQWVQELKVEPSFYFLF